MDVERAGWSVGFECGPLLVYSLNPCLFLHSFLGSQIQPYSLHTPLQDHAIDTSSINGTTSHVWSQIVVTRLDNLFLPLPDHVTVNIPISGNSTVCHIADTNHASGQFFIK